MKELRYHAWISWLPEKKGGREAVPTELYWMDAQFALQKGWPAAGWTLVVRPTRLFEGNRLQVAKIDFLVDDAPRDLIAAGARFKLLDGLRAVANGLVVDGEDDGHVSRQAIEEVLLV